MFWAILYSYLSNVQTRRNFWSCSEERHLWITTVLHLISCNNHPAACSTQMDICVATISPLMLSHKKWLCLILSPLNNSIELFCQSRCEKLSYQHFLNNTHDQWICISIETQFHFQAILLRLARQQRGADSYLNTHALLKHRLQFWLKMLQSS